MNRNLWISLALLILVIALLIFGYSLLIYAKSEGFKCLANPMGYAYNHTKFTP